MQQLWLINNSSQLNMFREIILPIFRSTSCNTQSSAPEDGQNNCPKHVGLTGIINKPLLLHLVACQYYLYQWCTVKQISDNEIYLLIKYIKSVLWRGVKCLSYIEDARCLKVKWNFVTAKASTHAQYLSLQSKQQHSWKHHNYSCKIIYTHM